MLAEDQSLLADILREQGKNATLLSDLLYTKLRADTNTTLIGEKTPPATISIGLANVLSVAETEMQRHKQKEISEPLLLLSLLKQSDDIGQFLTRAQEVRWRDLIRSVQKRLNRGD